jgi:flavin reductase (DIM6/NTAB) family NADH-FMN oxidoreductase RutF
MNAPGVSWGSRRRAASTRRDSSDKFARCEWRPGPGGVPLIEDCRSRFVGRILGHHDAGDHVAFLLVPVSAEKGHQGAQFRFHRAKRIEPGHQP